MADSSSSASALFCFVLGWNLRRFGSSHNHCWFFHCYYFFNGLLFWSLREPVPFTRLCISFVLLVSSLFCKLVLLFLIYTFLTFDKKKKRGIECIGFECFNQVRIERSIRVSRGDPSTSYPCARVVQHNLI